MGLPRSPEKAVLFTGALFSSPDVLACAEPALREKFGEVFFSSPALPWNHSQYYVREMGSPIYRTFIFFSKVIEPSLIVSAKLTTIEIEKYFSTDNKRRINLDPGYMTLAKVVLASAKNYSHRIYLGRGIYGELELFYMNGRFNPLPYTYMDFREESVKTVFKEARRLLKKRMIRERVRDEL
jgi:hypothetical protein